MSKKLKRYSLVKKRYSLEEAREVIVDIEVAS